VEYLSGSPLLGRILASPANIRLGREGPTGANNVVYFGIIVSFKEKSFIVLTHKLKMQNA
jgi:hypothetical protein